MCGIFGQINKTEKVSKEQITKCTNSMKSRGPDSSGVFIDKNVGLGFRRLAIIDLSENGNQPMVFEDEKLALVFNGEIYNHLGIKKSLDVKKWNSVSDTEVLLRGYLKYGSAIVNHLEGMFAFGIYDKKDNKVVLARDHFGKKPLYYYYDKDTFVFSSEIKALLQIPSVKGKLEIDTLSLNKFMFYGYVPSPNSIFKQIKKVKPSTVVEFDIRKWEITSEKNFWNLNEIVPEVTKSEDDILRDLDTLLEESVRKRLISDVPVGMFLSGGLDSSLISYYMGKLGAKVDTYTVSYSNNKDIDETKYAKEVAEKFGLKYNLCEFKSSLVKDNFLEIMDYLDEPLADAAIVPLYFVSKQAQKSFTVALSGDGGDEVFGGYSKYKAQELIEKLSFLRSITPLISNIVPKNTNIHKFLESFDMPLEQRQFIFGSGSFLSDEAEDLLVNNYDLSDVFSEAQSHLDSFNSKDIVNSSMFLDCKIQLPDWYLVKGDRATMANSQEMRNPLLDKNLAEYLFKLPGNLKVRNGETKYLEKKLLAEHMGHEFVYRDKKGFGAPLDKWIQKELKDVFDVYLYIDNGYFNLDVVKRLHEEHLSGRFNNQFKLLRIFAFNYFMDKWL